MQELTNNYKLSVARVRKAFDLAARQYDRFAVLQQTVADRLCETFEYLRVTPTAILDLGSGTGYGSRKLKLHFKKAHIYQADVSRMMLKQSEQQSSWFSFRDHFLCADAKKLPLPDNQFDLVFCSLMLQWCDDLDAVFVEIQRVLKPGGLFLFATFGPDSLKEMRESWRATDDQVHVNTFIDMHDIGDSLVRHGLGAPVLNAEHMTLMYDDCRQLMLELKKIGANNINSGRRKTLTGKKRLMKVMEHYESYRMDNKLPVTYEVIYGHAWCSDNKPTGNNDNKIQSIALEELKQDLANRKK